MFSWLFRPLAFLFSLIRLAPRGNSFIPRRKVGYRQATRHPWPCLLFLLPLLLAYEGGILWIGGSQPDMLRNGADTWLRWGLDRFGLTQLYWPPVLIVAVFLVWSWFRWDERPDDLSGVCLGMALESVGFALALWALSRGLGPLLETVAAQVNGPAPIEEGLAQTATFVGAGIYEEVLFRLLLYSGLLLAARLVGLPGLAAVAVAALTSATVFSAAHHVGPYGEAFDEYAFLFRTVAGLYFTALYQVRGFGIAVGTHACYDVLVGVSVG